MMRLQKYLARSGVASRRNSEKIILEGRVCVNGNVVSELGASVDETTDEVTVDGKVVKPIDKKVVLLLNKPTGYITAMSDPQDRPIVKDLIDIEKYPGLFPVGRLDLTRVASCFLLTMASLVPLSCIHLLRFEKPMSQRSAAKSRLVI